MCHRVFKSFVTGLFLMDLATPPRLSASNIGDICNLCSLFEFSCFFIYLFSCFSIFYVIFLLFHYSYLPIQLLIWKEIMIDVVFCFLLIEGLNKGFILGGLPRSVTSSVMIENNWVYKFLFQKGSRSA